jgi:hypothetical protein
MAKYGTTAVRAVERMQRGVPADAAWKSVADELFPDAPDARCKSCPREAFLGLCEAGLVQGVARKSRMEPVESPNRKYAVTAIRLLEADPDLARGSKIGLWRRVMAELGEDPGKKHNQQIDVVLSLWEAGLIDTTPNRRT